MLKKSIIYTNPFTQAQVTEEHYFHLSKADVVEMNMEEHKATYRNKEGEDLEGLEAKLAMISESEDAKQILAELKDVIRRAYGVKDGDRFIKSKDNWDAFSSTEAYSQLLFDLYTNATEAGEFMSGLLPNNLRAELAAAGATGPSGSTPTPSVEVPAAPTEPELIPVPEAAPEEAPPAPSMTAERKAVLDLASATNPIKLDQVDVVGGDAQYIQDGVRTGRFQL